MLCGRWLHQMPTNNWMRDDRLGGLASSTDGMLTPVFVKLHAKGLLAVALEEKAAATERWVRMEAAAAELRRRTNGAAATSRTAALGSGPRPMPVAASAVLTSCTYGRTLSEIIEAGWAVLAQGFVKNAGGALNCSALRGSLQDYDSAWAAFHAMHNSFTWMPSAYHDYFWSNELDKKPAGMGASVDSFRPLCAPHATSESSHVEITDISGSVSAPSPDPFLFPSFTFVTTIANDTTGNIRDPSSVVQDPKTGKWHFYVDYMKGKLSKSGWHAYLHHYSAVDIEGPWINHGIAKGLNHSSTTATAWDNAGTFSSSLIYDADDASWYLFYSALPANHSLFGPSGGGYTCAQLVAVSSSPGGPWRKLGLVAEPVGSAEKDWSKAWNARRLDSGRALVVAGVKSYWTKGCMINGANHSVCTEGTYLPTQGHTFAPPYAESASNPLYKATATDSDPYGYENCEFFMGPAGEVGHATGLMHIMCLWHGSVGPPGLPQGSYAHFVADPARAHKWKYVGSINTTALDGALEPTPVYEPRVGGGAVGIPGDQATVRQFIARQNVDPFNPRGISIGLYNLTWLPAD